MAAFLAWLRTLPFIPSAGCRVGDDRGNKKCHSCSWGCGGSAHTSRGPVRTSESHAFIHRQRGDGARPSVRGSPWKLLICGQLLWKNKFFSLWSAGTGGVARAILARHFIRRGKKKRHDPILYWSTDRPRIERIGVKESKASALAFSTLHGFSVRHSVGSWLAGGWPLPWVDVPSRATEWTPLAGNEITG